QSLRKNQRVTAWQHLKAGNDLARFVGNDCFRLTATLRGDTQDARSGGGYENLVVWAPSRAPPNTVCITDCYGRTAGDRNLLEPSIGSRVKPDPVTVWREKGSDGARRRALNGTHLRVGH